MSNWLWRVVVIKVGFVILSLLSFLKAQDSIQKLPFCNLDSSSDGFPNNDLVIVSTLDGRLTAFSTDNGIKAWTLQTQPLLSSNLHHVELTAGGKWVRLVPSLRGTLYSLSGDTVEPLPFDAEQLLSSSFKYSDDLVIAGSRETLWVGVDPQSGGTIYQCGSAGCSNDQPAAAAGRDILVLRRNSNTLRALEPRSGSEKWNFSVAEHQLALSQSIECLGRNTNGPEDMELSVAVALPEGMVGVRKASTPEHVIWQQKLEAPIAGMWRLKAGTLKSIDILWASTKSLSSDNFIQMTPPSLYIGLHNEQLYVQEGQLYVANIETSITPKPRPWKLKTARPLLSGPNTGIINLHDSDPNTLALITLYGSAAQSGNQGFFLYGMETCEQGTQVSEEQFLEGEPEILPPDESDNQGDHHHVHVHVYSLWFWWKEVLLIAISSALLMNLMIWPRFFAPRFRPPTPLSLNREYIVMENHYERPASNVQSTEYSGRYENDFTPLKLLGRGGFGVVFEARNNIDHCSYAVKRITLPRRQSKRERVLREVRALAKLEHEHIVRYFNAWLEEPPPNWQEERDAAWMRELDGVSLIMTDDTLPKEVTGTKSPLSSDANQIVKSNSIMLNLEKPQWEKSIDACFSVLERDKNNSEPNTKRHRSFSCSESFSIEFEDNATKNPPKNCLKNSLDLTSELNIPKNLTLSKNLGGGDNDDSFIVFENTGDINHNSKSKHDVVRNIHLEKVQDCDVSKTNSTADKKKKKGHRRHWSLDMCVKSTEDDCTNSRRGIKMYLYIQMQLCRSDSLHDWLRQHRTYEARYDKVKSLFSQIVSAVEYVHLAGLIHRDLKPSNIFFAPDGKVKVGDFGLVTTMTDSSQDSDEGVPHGFNIQTRHTHRVGTHLYMSPEQLSGRPYSYKVDIYSLGLILFELLQPFGTEAERVTCLLRLREGRYPRHFQQKFLNEMDVLKLMLSEDPSTRPTASGVRARAPLFQETDERWHFILPTVHS